MRKTLQAKYIASEIHAVLFIAMWVLYSVFSQPLADGPSAVLFVILFIVDLPISFVAFGVLLTSAKYGGVAALLWGVLGTLWWYLIGLAIDARIRSHRESRAMEAQQGLTTANHETTGMNYRRAELLIAFSTVGLMIIASLAWAWNGAQGHFEKGKIGNLAFSPDSRLIVLVRSKGDLSTIEKVDLASNTSTPIKTAIPCTASSPTYSPDGKQIALVCRNNADNHSRIFLMDADGGNFHPLCSANSDSYDFAPHYSSDGETLFFARIESFVPVAGISAPVRQNWDAYSASIDGREERQVTDRHFKFFGVTFSGDGRKLVVSGDDSSGVQIYVYSTDEQVKGEIAIHPPIPNAPQSPVISDVIVARDGRSIYFMAATDGKKAFDYDVYRMDLTSNSVEKLTIANGYATDLCVSNDGKMAAFLRWTSEWGSLPNLSRLYTLDLESKRLTPSNVTGTQ